MALLALLTSNRARAKRISVVCRSYHSVEAEATWSGFQQYVKEHPVSAVIIDLSHPELEQTDLTAVQRFCEEHPSTGVAVLTRRHASSLELFRLGQLGLQHVSVIWEEASDQTVLHAISHSLDTSPASAAIRSVGTKLTWWEREALWTAINGVGLGWSSDDFAKAMNMTRRRLARELGERDLPRPARVLMLSRILHGVHAVSEPSRSARKVAEQVGYANPHIFFRAVKDALGRTPMEASEQGGIALVVQELLREAGRLPEEVE